MIGITNWGAPIAQVARRNRSFSQAFGVAPQPRCSQDECIKFYQSNYAIPVPGSTRIDRTVELLLRLRMTDGRVVRAELLMPNKGFSRWYEQENRTIVMDEDPTQRQQAIEWALGKIIPSIREVAPNAASLDVVPEPIDPPRVRAPNMPDTGASLAPGDEPTPAPAETEAATPTPTPTPTPQEGGQEGGAGQAQEGGGDDLDALLSAAAGGDQGQQQQQQQQQTAEVAPPPSEPEEMVLPIALQGFSAGGLRIVLFAAGEEDYGAAYDGLFIEFEPPRVEEATPRRGRGRGRARGRATGMTGMMR
jgi:hypothetical protein